MKFEEDCTAALKTWLSYNDPDEEDESKLLTWDEVKSSNKPYESGVTMPSQYKWYEIKGVYYPWITEPNNY